MAVTNNVYIFYLNDFRFLSSLQALPTYIDQRGEAQNPGSSFTGSDPRTPNSINFEDSFLKVIQFHGEDELGSGFFINCILNVSSQFLQAFFANSIELFIRYLNALSDDSFVSGVFWRIGLDELTDITLYQVYEGNIRGAQINRRLDDGTYDISLQLVDRFRVLDSEKQFSVYRNTADNRFSEKASLSSTSGITLEALIEKVTSKKSGVFTKDISYRTSFTPKIHYNGIYLNPQKMTLAADGSTQDADFLVHDPDADTVTEKYTSRYRHRIQYDETDYEFLNRIFEQEGITTLSINHQMNVSQTLEHVTEKYFYVRTLYDYYDDASVRVTATQIQSYPRLSSLVEGLSVEIQEQVKDIDTIELMTAYGNNSLSLQRNVTYFTDYTNYPSKYLSPIGIYTSGTETAEGIPTTGVTNLDRAIPEITFSEAQKNLTFVLTDKDVVETTATGERKQVNSNEFAVTFPMYRFNENANETIQNHREFRNLQHHKNICPVKITLGNYSEYTDHFSITRDFSPITSSATLIKGETDYYSDNPYYSSVHYSFVRSTDDYKPYDAYFNPPSTYNAGSLYFYGETIESPQDANRMVIRRLESYRWQANYYTAEGKVIDMRAGAEFIVLDTDLKSAFSGNPVAVYNYAYVIKDTFSGISGFEELVGENNVQGRPPLSGENYSNSFEFIIGYNGDNLVYRPKVTRKKKISGTLNAIIEGQVEAVDTSFYNYSNSQDNILNQKTFGFNTNTYPDIDAFGRYLIRFIFDPLYLKYDAENTNEPNNSGTGLDEALQISPKNFASTRLRKSEFFACGHDLAGVHFALSQGTQVLISFIEGNPDMPFISGAVDSPHQQSDLSKFFQANKASFIRTQGGSGIYLIDENASGDERTNFGSQDIGDGISIETSLANESLSLTGAANENTHPVADTTSPMENPNNPGELILTGENYLDVSQSTYSKTGVRMGTHGFHQEQYVAGENNLFMSSELYLKAADKTGVLKSYIDTVFPLAIPDFSEVEPFFGFSTKQIRDYYLLSKQADGSYSMNTPINDSVITEEIFTFRSVNQNNKDEKLTFVPDLELRPKTNDSEYNIDDAFENEMVSQVNRKVGTFYTYRKGKDFLFHKSGLNEARFGSRFRVYVAHEEKTANEIDVYSPESFNSILKTQYEINNSLLSDPGDEYIYDFSVGTSGGNIGVTKKNENRFANNTKPVDIEKYIGNRLVYIDGPHEEMVAGDKISVVGGRSRFYFKDHVANIYGDIIINADKGISRLIASSESMIHLKNFKKFVQNNYLLHLSFDIDMTVFIKSSIAESWGVDMYRFPILNMGDNWNAGLLLFRFMVANYHRGSGFTPDLEVGSFIHKGFAGDFLSGFTGIIGNMGAVMVGPFIQEMELKDLTIVQMPAGIIQAMKSTIIA